MDQRKGSFHPPFFQIYFVTWDLNLINMYIDLKKWTIIFLLVISQNRHIKHIWIMRWQHKFTGWLQNQTHHPWKVWGRAEAAQQEFRASTHFLVWGWQHSYINMSYIWLNMADKASIEQFAPGKDSEDTKMCLVSRVTPPANPWVVKEPCTWLSGGSYSNEIST